MNRMMKRTVTLLLALVMVLSVLPAAQAAALKKGSSGTDVKHLQQNLIGLGFLTGEADGKFGSKTEAAVSAFQKNFGLAVDGSAGYATQTAVRNAIVRLQVELANAGFNPGSADGHFGSKTQSALKAYQKARGLAVSGIADTKTWSEINRTCGGMVAGAKVSRGGTGTQVKYLQQALIGMGYLFGTADGRYGSITTEAVRQFQDAYGLSVDGNAGPDTMTSLRNAVSALQSDLGRKGWYSSGIDGVYGNGTRSAVKSYQLYAGLSVDGIAGPATMKKLYGYSLGGSNSSSDSRVYQTAITMQYQTGDTREIWYDSGRKISKTVESSGCAGVALAMALNALKNTNKYNGYNVMMWFVEHGYYKGHGTYHTGMVDYPRVLGLNTAYCSKRSSMVEHLKKNRLALVLLRDRTGEAIFVGSESTGHYVLVSGYRVKDGEEQVYINNPLRDKRTGWFDLDDLMDNTNFRDGFSPIVIVYR